MSFLNLFKQKKICITHNGTFHADDLFASATLSILNDGNIKVIRTRDPKIINSGDYVYDVGAVYDEKKDLFDHHQKGGAGKRENGVPYSSFGLVWRKYGGEICGNKEVAELIDKKIVQPIDAKDNGLDISNSVFTGIFPYGVEAIFLSEIPTWKEDNIDIYKIFIKQLDKVIILLKREIKIAKDDIEGKSLIIKNYKDSYDKRIIIGNTDFPRYLFQNTLSAFPEPIYFIYPSSHNNSWKVEAIRKSTETMESRKLFPEEWRGSMDVDGNLKKITGVDDAGFCHQNGFLLTAGSKEGAIILAEKALLA
jgi:uncharacterized UPF0160 family protein